MYIYINCVYAYIKFRYSLQSQLHAKYYLITYIRYECYEKYIVINLCLHIVSRNQIPTLYILSSICNTKIHNISIYAMYFLVRINNCKFKTRRIQCLFERSNVCLFIFKHTLKERVIVIGRDHRSRLQHCTCTVLQY